MSLKSVQKIFFSLLFFGILLLGFLNSYNRYIDNVSLSHQDMVEKINIIKSNVDIESIKHLKAEISDTNNLYYLKLQKQLTALNNAFMDVRYIYILGVCDSSFIFHIDTQPNNRLKDTISQLAMPGEVYIDAPEDFYLAYSSKKEMICGPYEDKWGKFVSIVTPIIDYNSPEVVAMIGVDIPYDESVTMYQFENFIPFILSVIAVLIILILYFFVGRKILDDKKQIAEYEKIRASINQINYPIIIINQNLRVQYFNPAATYLLQTALFKEIINEIHVDALFLDYQFKQIGDLINSKIQNDDISSGKVYFPDFFENKQLRVDITPIMDAEEELNQFVLLLELLDNTPMSSSQDSISQESAGKMEMILEHIKEVVWELDFEGMIISCSSSIFHLLGYNSEDVVYKSFYTILSSKSAEKFKNSVQNAYHAVRNNAKVEDVFMVLEMSHKTYGFVEVELHMSLPKNDFNEPYGIIIVGRKVNENIDAIMQLYETKKTVQTYFSHIPGMLYRCAIDREWTMKFISNGCFDLTGYEVEEVLENKKIAFNELILPEYREILWGKWYKSIENKLSFESEYEIKTASGEIKWVFEKGRCVYDEQAVPIALEGFIIDVSERKKSEKLLQENEKRFRNYLENSNIAIFVTDIDGNITDFNRSLYELTKIESSTLLKSKVQSFIHPDNLDSFIRQFGLVQSTGQINLVVKIQCGEACGKNVMLFASLINQDELVFYVIDIDGFVSEKQQLQNQLTLLKKSIKNIPFTCFLINGETKEVVESSHYIDIFDRNHCPCSILNNQTEANCELNLDICLIQNFEKDPQNNENIFEVKVGKQTKNYRSIVSEINIDIESFPKHYLITVIDITENAELNAKIDSASNSLDKMFSYYFKNNEQTYQQLHAAFADQKIEVNDLAMELNYHARRAEFSSHLLSKKTIDDTTVFYPNNVLKDVLNKLYYSKVNQVYMDLFYADYLNGQLELRFSEERLYSIIEFLIDFVQKHCIKGVPVLSQRYCVSDNSYKINAVIEVYEAAYKDMDMLAESSFFDIFNQYPNIHSSIIDFAFIKRVYEMNNCKFQIEKLENYSVECSIVFDSVASFKTESPKTCNSKIGFLTSNESILKYYSSLFPPSETIYYFNNYLSAIKSLNTLKVFDFPDVFVMHYHVNNIEATDFIDLFNFNRLQTNPKLIIILPKSELNRMKLIYDAKYDNIYYLCYPFTKEDFFNLLNC
ncbi:MAG: PAS domain S-box protein [Bacteroidales bacterium]|nr:PAS domain S-box protein [Bacteroidales bacterium]